ncbi:ParB N-terminal domain-containing protein [Anaerocolumna sedimenticola]|uniref:ParB N-terminal domain-containing protein n=1 Tax=Anaerocolumna sedimenticola TaxID=2696063 RepID=A0A6P1TRE1_9FIRM|nr:site-specific DNA-methyltransferase [Anaerocolumna sedimenticola]QHQ63830.1 ParB N-terminal domain-containing protein [Anaerocolumna sedimenticola]
MQIEKKKTAELLPAEYNPRKDLKPGDPEYEKLKRSLEEFGYVEPIIWNKNTGRIVGGHQRLKVLINMGITEVECVIIEMDEEKEKALNIALNKISGDWDKDKLALLITDLQGADFDVSLTGFDVGELDDLFSGINKSEAVEDNFELTKALEEAAFVEKGDVWTVGRHRLVCGDATEAETVKNLMNDRKANLILTDPPYAVSFKSSSGLTIMNDSMKSEEFYNFLLMSFTNMANSLEDGGSAYIFHADTEGLNFRKAFVDAGFHLSGVCIWAKNSFVMGRSPYQWKHEPILYGWLKSGKHRWYAGRSESTIWSFDKPKKNENHPTSKPIDLLSYPIKNSCQVNGLVLDLFGGSGSTLIACEQTDRICYMMELDEKYASVILRRYVEFKKNCDDVTVERNGKVLCYADVAKDIKGKDRD